MAYEVWGPWTWGRRWFCAVRQEVAGDLIEVARFYGDSADEARALAQQFTIAADAIDVCRTVRLWLTTDGDAAAQADYVLEKIEQVLDGGAVVAEAG